MNGSMYVSHVEISMDDLSPEELESVTIIETDDEGKVAETVLNDAICDGVLHWPEGWLFNLREPSQQERTIANLQSQLDMQTECILEMSEIIYG